MVSRILLATSTWPLFFPTFLLLPSLLLEPSHWYLFCFARIRRPFPPIGPNHQPEDQTPSELYTRRKNQTANRRTKSPWTELHKPAWILNRQPMNQTRTWSLNKLHQPLTPHEPTPPTLDPHLIPPYRPASYRLSNLAIPLSHGVPPHASLKTDIAELSSLGQKGLIADTLLWIR